MSTQIAKRDKQPAPAQRQSQDIYGAVLAAVKDPNTDPVRLEKFLALAKEMEGDYARRQYVAAFHAAKADLDDLRIDRRGKITYQGKGGRGGSTITYARYDDIAKTVKPVLRRHGLSESYSYETSESPPKTICVMTLTHAAGHSETFRSAPLPMVDSSGGKTDVQGVGSTMSYGKRFVIVAAFDIVTEGEDDDGSGQGVAEPITDEQAATIEACLDTIEGKEPKSKTRFFDWLERSHKIRNIRELTQGPQFEGVMELLRKKLKT